MSSFGFESSLGKMEGFLAELSTAESFSLSAQFTIQLFYTIILQFTFYINIFVHKAVKGRMGHNPLNIRALRCRL